MTHTVKILKTHPAPAARPQPIAFHEGLLWVGCWETKQLFAIDPATWTTKHVVDAPGVTYGIAPLGGALHVVVSIGEEDDRYVYRLVPGQPFTEDGRFACPDFTGSHLTTNGKSLYLVQQTHRQMLELGAGGDVVRTIKFPSRTAGVAFGVGAFYVITADDDFDVLELGTLDIETPGASVAVLAPMNVESRGLAFDGSSWWTSYRELGEIVSFAV